MNAEHAVPLSEKISQAATVWTGTTQAFMIALAVIAVWAAAGPTFGYSDTWQLVINTGTTVVTFLMVFLIQRTQNKESVAVQVKLDELIRAVKGASNRMIAVEGLSEEELNEMKVRFEALAERWERRRRRRAKAAAEK